MQMPRMRAAEEKQTAGSHCTCHVNQSSSLLSRVFRTMENGKALVWEHFCEPRIYRDVLIERFVAIFRFGLKSERLCRISSTVCSNAEVYFDGYKNELRDAPELKELSEVDSGFKAIHL